MTRINIVPVQELCNKHLFSEAREITRLVKGLDKSLNRKSKPFSMSEIPSQYVLGKGHTMFFYDKFKYLHERHQELVRELLKRGYNLTYTDSNIFTTVDSKWYGDYQPTKEALELNRERIRERMPKNPKWTLNVN